MLHERVGEWKPASDGHVPGHRGGQTHMRSHDKRAAGLGDRS